MPGSVMSRLFQLWCGRGRIDEYVGSLVNAYIAGGGQASGVRAGTAYVDVGTLHGYREAIRLLETATLKPDPATGNAPGEHFESGAMQKRPGTTPQNL